MGDCQPKFQRQSGARTSRSWSGIAALVLAAGGVLASPPARAATTLQSTIDAAAAGSTIDLGAGNFVEDLSITKPLTLRCANAGISAGATPGTRQAETTIEGQHTVTAAGVVIDGCRFVRPDVASSDVPRLLRSEGVSAEVTVRNSIFDLTDVKAAARNSRGCGAGVSGTAAWRISDSLFRSQFYDQFSSACGSSGQRYTSRMIFAENAQPVIVEGNRFESVSQSIFLTGDQPSGSIFLNNQFTDSSALFMGTPAEVLIKGNTFDGGGAIYLDGSQGTIIENNLLTARSTYLVYSVNATDGAILRNNAILGKYTFGGENFEGFGVFNLGAGAMEATDNWWGVTSDSEVGAMIRQVGTVTFDPWLSAGESVPNPDNRYATGFWPPSSVGSGRDLRSGSDQSATLLREEPVAGFLQAPDGSAPTVSPGSVSIVTSDGEEVAPEVRVGEGELLAGATVRITAPGLAVESIGDRGVSAERGPVASVGGEIVSRIEADIPAGSVVEVWLFSTPRLVAAARADVDGQVDVTVPLSAPLDGGGPVEAGTHTMQLLIPTSSGTIGVNVGVTVGGPVPTSVPSGAGPSVPVDPEGLLGMLVLGGLLFTMHRRRRGVAPGPA